MKCVKILLAICFAMATWPGSFGSLMNLNETMFTDLPPLYHLDEWSRCQRPNDVYCMVDAALRSPGPSPLLDYLKTYSKETRKHYNRTIVHRGVCITRCGGDGPETWRSAAERCLNDSLAEYGLEAEVLEMDFCNTPETSHASSTTTFNIVFLIILVVTFMATVIHILGGRCGRMSDNRYVLALSLKRNWQILTHLKSSEEGNDRTKDLICLEGFRFIGTICVVLTHVTIVYVYSYIDNPEFIEHMFDNVGGKVAFNTPLWMQVFFSISGFLTTYFVLIYTETNSFTFFKCILSLVNRYIRLTPVSLFALWFTIVWYPQLGSGPQWAWLIQREAQDCTERWWYHAIYVHNNLELGKYCMGHTWYLGADMQLHVLGLILLLIFMKWRRVVKPIIFVLLLGSIMASGLVVYFFNLTPIITAQSPEVVRSMFKGSRVMKILYLPAWMNISGYAMGIATAFIYYHNQTEGYKLNESKWFRVVFRGALAAAAGASLAGVLFLSERAPPRWAAVSYGALDRALVALCFNVFLLGCISNCKSFLRDALCWRGFQVLGKLSYTVFIVHFIIMRFSVACNTQIGHVSAYSMISLLVVGTVLSYIVAVPIYLLIELPPVQLWKAIIGPKTVIKTERDPQHKVHCKIDHKTSRRNGNREIA